MTGLPRVGLVQACDDARLFNFPLWPKQRELLRSVEERPGGHIWAIGRQSGKSTMAGLVLLWDLLFKPELDALMRPGTVRYAIAVATKLAQSRDLVAEAAATVENSPLLEPLLESRTSDELLFRLPSGARVALRGVPCSSRGLRGITASSVCLDEAAHMVSTADGYAAASMIWQAARPLTRRFGAKATLLISSTPFGSSGFFADRYHRVDTGQIPGWTATHASSDEMDPSMGKDQLAALEAEDPETFPSEILALFDGGGAGFIDFSRFDVLASGEVPPEAGTHWVAGLDAAFSRDPFAVITVGRAVDDPRRLVVGAVEAFKPPKAKAFEAKRSVEDRFLAQVAEVCTRYGAHAVGDSHKAPEVRARLAEHGVHMQALPMTQTLRYAAYKEMRSRLYDGALALPPDDDLLIELRRVRTKIDEGSPVPKIILPRSQGNHCDRVAALSLACYEQARRGWSSGQLRTGPGLPGGAEQAIALELRARRARRRSPPGSVRRVRTGGGLPARRAF